MRWIAAEGPVPAHGRDPVTPAGAAAHPQAGTRSAGATMVRGRATAEGKADTGRGA